MVQPSERRHGFLLADQGTAWLTIRWWPRRRRRETEPRAEVRHRGPGPYAAATLARYPRPVAAQHPDGPCSTTWAGVISAATAASPRHSHPNIDRLARRGLQLTSCYRAVVHAVAGVSFMTNPLPAASRLHSDRRCTASRAPRRRVALAELLSAAGYVTRASASGTSARTIGPKPQNVGFDDFGFLSVSDMYTGGAHLYFFPRSSGAAHRWVEEPVQQVRCPRHPGR